MNNVLMIFIDGIGIGNEDKVYNPFFKYQFQTFLKHFDKIPSLKNPIQIGRASCRERV